MAQPVEIITETYVLRWLGIDLTGLNALIADGMNYIAIEAETGIRLFNRQTITNYLMTKETKV